MRRKELRTEGEWEEQVLRGTDARGEREKGRRGSGKKGGGE